MSNRFTRAAAMAAALALPATLAAQAPRPMAARPATPSANASAEARTWLNELQRISARLQAAHNRAMEDAQLRAAQEAFMRDVKASMQRTDPGLDVLATRVRTIQAEGAAAQQRGDRARLRTLNQELSQIQARFMTAQENVMKQPAMARRAKQLEERLHARMLQVEPETDRLIARGKELQSRLARVQQAARQQQPPPAGPRRQ